MDLRQTQVGEGRGGRVTGPREGWRRELGGPRGFWVSAERPEASPNPSFSRLFRGQLPGACHVSGAGNMEQAGPSLSLGSRERDHSCPESSEKGDRRVHGRGPSTSLGAPGRASWQKWLESRVVKNCKGFAGRRETVTGRGNSTCKGPAVHLGAQCSIC